VHETTTFLLVTFPDIHRFYFFTEDSPINVSYLVTNKSTTSWRRGVVVSGVRRMNEVNARRARLVPGWVTRLRAGIPSRYVTSPIGQLSLASPGVA